MATARSFTKFTEKLKQIEKVYKLTNDKFVAVRRCSCTYGMEI